MAVEGDIPTVDVENTGDQGSAIKILAPVLEQDVGIAVSQNLDPLPDGHPLFEMLFFNLTHGNRFDRALDQVMSFFHNLFVATDLSGDFTGDGEFNFFLG